MFFKLSSCSVTFLAIIWFIQSDDDYTNNFVVKILDYILATDLYVLPVDNKEAYTTSDKVEAYGNFDFVIVGAGSAGSVLANRLSEITRWKILLLEVGGEQNDFSYFPGTSILLSFTDMNWGYYSTPQKTGCLGMKEKKCIASRGKVVGGTSSINARVHVRGNKEDYNNWERMGNPGWSYRYVLPYFKKSEHFHPSPSWETDMDFRGTDGPLSVVYNDPTPFTYIFLNACRQVGLPTIDYNGDSQVGVSQIQTNMRGIKMESAGSAFLQPIRNRVNLNVTTNAFVTKVLIDEDSMTAYGVEFVKDSQKYIANASKEVILSAGSFNSPQILILSGIGPEEELSRLGIPLLADLPVGKNLQDHTCFLGLFFRTNFSLYEGKSLIDLLNDYLDGRQPLMTPAGMDSNAFVKVNNESSTVPDIQLYFIPPAGASNFYQKFLNFEVNIYDKIDPHTDGVLFVELLNPKSRGTITLKSSNPWDFPDIDHNLLSVEEDIETMYKGILKAFEILNAQPFRAVNATYVPVVSGCTEYVELSREYWYCTIRQLSTPFFHPVGTTRMGPKGNNSVVSSDLRVHGVNKLRVIDAGIMPLITSGNINIPTYMIAEKLSDEIKIYHEALQNGRLKKKKKLN